MPNELEQPLAATLRRPRPTRDATARARTAALATLPPARRRSLGWVAVLAAAALLAVVGVAAGALAASGKLHVVLGAPRVTPRAPRRLSVPSHSQGIAM